jgi:AcrR family transcriptional regulator
MALMMKKSIPVAKNKYHSPLRAEAEALTHQRIISAALSLYVEKWLDQITLDQIAKRAGVSVQTVLRHFGSAEALISAAGRAANDQAIQQRQNPPVGDIPVAISGLMDHYEAMSPTGLRTLALEGRYPELDALLVEGRQKHQEWVKRVFSPYLKRASKKDRQRLTVQLASLCDMYMWKLLRLDGGLSREQAEFALSEMLMALLRSKGLLEKGDDSDGHK